MLKKIIALIVLLCTHLSLNAQESGYVNTTEIGFSSWTNMDAAAEHMITATNISGYKLNPFFQVGFGYGYEHNFSAFSASENKAINLKQVPIFADFRIFMDDSQIRPFLFINPGYHFILNGKEDVDSYSYYNDYSKTTDYSQTTVECKGGLYMNMGLGLQFLSEGTKAYHISLGYKYEKQESTEEFVGSFNNVVTMRKYESKLDKSYFTIKLGYSF